ncbi:MAG: Nif3-like dinuclear metal center hexameric protein [Propionibacteriaceae bacterium]
MSTSPDAPATSDQSPTLSEVVDLVHNQYPPSTAEGWDSVGLVTGEPDAPVGRVLFTVDVTPEVVRQAIDTGADLIIAHHPLLLKGIHAVDVAHPKGRMIADLIKNDVALLVAHTNADIPATGTVDSLATALGLTDTRPMVPAAGDPLDKIVAFVPTDHTEQVVDAMAAAGAGAIGDYDRCHFVTSGTGSFRPLDGANPFLGEVGQVEHVPEDRVEMVLPRNRRMAVLEALHATHPYETPAWDLFELAATESGSGLGRVGLLPATVTLRAFAEQVAAALPATAGGIRVGGDLDRPVRRIAVQAGAGDGLLDRARQLSADVFVTSDLRHHPASEALAWPDGPALIDIAHWAAEWTWLPVAEAWLAEELSERGWQVTTEVSTICTDPWTATFGD